MSVPSFDPTSVPSRFSKCRPPRTRPSREPRPGPALLSVSTATSDEQLTELLLDEPLAFLSLAAEALSHPGRQPTEELISRLRAHGSIEAVAMAAAITWLSGGGRTDDPGIMATAELPLWLTALDDGRIVGARWRREQPNKTSYLLRIELADGREGTMQGRIDHAQGDALTNAWFTDEPLETIDQLITTLTRHQNHRFVDLKAHLAANALAHGVEAADGATISSPAVNRWPGLRPLVEFGLTTWSTR